MKRLAVLLAISLFLVGSAMAISVTTGAIDNSTGIHNQGSYEGVSAQVQNKNLTQEQVRNIIQERKRLRVQSGECAENCTCSGSTTKSPLLGGGRELTVVAGNSGNIIVQVKNVNASTKVVLYKDGDEVYGVFKGNKTKIVRVLPDAVMARIRERVQTRLENQEMELNEDGDYDYQARKRARLFGFIPVRVRVKAKINSENGEVIRLRNSWWAFLASDEAEDLLVG